MTMYIIMKNQLDCEIDRTQVFHGQTVKKALIEFVKGHYIEPGDKYEIIESDEAFREFNEMKYHKED